MKKINIKLKKKKASLSYFLLINLHQINYFNILNYYIYAIICRLFIKGTYILFSNQTS